MSPRLPTHIESAAYYVIWEALANLNKHSMAIQAQIVGRLNEDFAVVTVADDGIGGASVAKCHGLAGLADRLTAAEGELTVYSPPAGPQWCRLSIDPEIIQQVFSQHRRNDPVQELTQREREVLVLMAQGHSNARIAGAGNVRLPEEDGCTDRRRTVTSNTGPMPERNPS